MAVKFIIDSASDVLPAECEALGVTHLPLTVRFGEKEYADGVDITPREFYKELTTNPDHPTTSQISPAAFENAYKKLTVNGDQVVVITISSKLSGTYQSAVIAAADFEGKVWVVDSLSATAGERVMLNYGMELAAQGMSAADIAAQLDTVKGKVRIFAYLDTLEYLKKGGRISATTAVVGGLLNIKPVITVEDGEVVSIGKARGAKAGNQMVRDLVEKQGGIDTDKPFVLVYSGDTEENVQKFAEDSAYLWQGAAQPPIAAIGSVIGTHVGPGAVAIAYFEK